ncbi:histidine triad nucleotide-binding protein [Betaproteobacteria bacterium]|nr:histidine triad nucleotide-binding protein [Betaproteobacteria bacterium]GHT96039.1 histidine triad nucleotide-binding protein [Betaproteobacteria bacterium]GHU02356.1 histidine triad nucleotide-binding protein [Betaproteobacteria bacterium]GHU12781.1 histidine triad nucleotide-binding protein [Betaproteobacteria bacterium]GHU24749.1 histidine triad nucleotide-binding protein [Betaproteobacteria bacterium]
MSDCIFCKIVAGEIPSSRAYEDDLVYAFHDIHPLRPTHVLVVPKKHIASLAHVSADDEPTLGRLLAVASKLAVDNGSTDGFRSIINTGRVGGQEVSHLHLHILGGAEPVGPMVSKT